MPKTVRFEELAVAGAKRLFSGEAVREAFQSSLALALYLDPTQNARRCSGIAGEFWVRGFYSGFEVRVLFELADEISVWSVAPAADLP